MLLKTQSLKTLLEFEDYSTAEIVTEFAKNNSIFSTLSQENSFKRFSWSALSQVKYATMNYTSSTKWKTMLEFIFGINGIQSEFVFVDAFCLHRPKKEMGKGQLLTATEKLFPKSSEHHIFEPGSIISGWTWHDLSLLSPLVRPTLHSSTIDIPLTEMLIDSIQSHGFDVADFSIPEDRDIVLNSILERWGSIERFNERVMDTVGSALDLAQVYSLYECIYVIVIDTDDINLTEYLYINYMTYVLNLSALYCYSLYVLITVLFLFSCSTVLYRWS